MYLYTVEMTVWELKTKKKSKADKEAAKGSGITPGDDVGRGFTEHYAANSLADVWAAIKHHDNDERTEITMIKRQVPILAILGKGKS